MSRHNPVIEVKGVEIFLGNDCTGTMPKEWLERKSPGACAWEVGKIEGKLFKKHKSGGIPLGVLFFGIEVNNAVVLINAL